LEGGLAVEHIHLGIKTLELGMDLEEEEEEGRERCECHEQGW